MKFALALLLALSASAAPHDRAYWKSIADANYRVPDGASAAALMDEVIELYASPDPDLRDDLAYSITAVWIYRDKVLTPAELRPIVKQLLANLDREPVLRRSFSALALSTIAARDVAEPFLIQDEFDDVLARTMAYLRTERDLRGFDAKVGWIHATAHTADVLKFLARDAKLRPAQQRLILDAIAARLASADVAFTHDEDERLARVCLSLIARSDFDLAAFRDSLQHFSMPPFANSEPVLVRRGNTKHFLESLLTLLTLDDRFAKSDAAAEVKATLLHQRL